jgi:hypothetical protein
MSLRCTDGRPSTDVEHMGQSLRADDDDDNSDAPVSLHFVLVD